MFVDAYQQSASGSRAKRDRAPGGSADFELTGVTYDLLELILRDAVFGQMLQWNFLAARMNVLVLTSSRFMR